MAAFSMAEKGVNLFEGKEDGHCILLVEQHATGVKTFKEYSTVHGLKESFVDMRERRCGG